MNRRANHSLISSLATGAVAGALSGATIGLLLQVSETVMFFPSQSPLATILTLTLSGAALGVGFGLLIHRQRPGAGEN
ncbi:MAG: hypothetical protein PVI04_09965, partial [Anaerolineales bacterium]